MRTLSRICEQVFSRAPGSFRLIRQAVGLGWLVLSLTLWLPCSARADVAQADSADFILDTTGTAPGAGGVAYADSGNFTLDTTGTPPGAGGVGYADSGNFTLDTTGASPGAGGVAFADSGDFVLDTTGVDSAYADSPDFMLDTRDAVDIGLRIFDGTAIIRIAGEAPGAGGQSSSPFRINKNGTNFGILLTDPNAADASKVRIQTSSGVKAWKKLP